MSTPRREERIRHRTTRRLSHGRSGCQSTEYSGKPKAHTELQTTSRPRKHAVSDPLSPFRGEFVRRAGGAGYSFWPAPTNSVRDGLTQYSTHRVGRRFQKLPNKGPWNSFDRSSLNCRRLEARFSRGVIWAGMAVRLDGAIEFRSTLCAAGQVSRLRRAVATVPPRELAPTSPVASNGQSTRARGSLLLLGARQARAVRRSSGESCHGLRESAAAAPCRQSRMRSTADAATQENPLPTRQARVPSPQSETKPNARS